MADFKYNHADYCHCFDYRPDICPEECFRARLTKELKEKPGYPYPVSYGNFLHSGFCPLDEGSEEDEDAT